MWSGLPASVYQWWYPRCNSVQTERKSQPRSFSVCVLLALPHFAGKVSSRTLHDNGSNIIGLAKSSTTLAREPQFTTRLILTKLLTGLSLTDDEKQAKEAGICYPLFYIAFAGCRFSGAQLSSLGEGPRVSRRPITLAYKRKGSPGDSGCPTRLVYPVGYTLFTFGRRRRQNQTNGTLCSSCLFRPST